MHLKGSMLDLILTNVPELFVDIRSEGRLGASDHFKLMAEVDTGKHSDLQQRTVRNWWKADWAAMKADLNWESWNIWSN
jgi:hypothetical protein